MKDWATLEPDRYMLMNKHFTAGRAGQKIEMVVIHHNAGILSIDDIWRVWQTRAASAHYQVTSQGQIGQLVYDRDTAWHAANEWINYRSIGIEVSNSGGPDLDWPITTKAIEEAAHLTAAVCVFYGLGRPVSGRNVRWHREFTSTSCPYRLSPGGDYHTTFMNRAVYWYDQMTVTPKKREAVIITSTEEQELMAAKDEIIRELTAHTTAEINRAIKNVNSFTTAFNGPIGQDVKDVRGQLTGSRDIIYNQDGSADLEASFPGWDLLGGDTVVEAIREVLLRLEDIDRRIDRFEKLGK